MRMTGYSFPTIKKACTDLVDANLAALDTWEWHIIGDSPQLVFGKQKSFSPITTDILINKDTKTLLRSKEVDENFLQLRKMGAGEPNRSRVWEMYSEKDLAEHIAYSKKKKEPVNYLLRRLLDRVPIPEDPDAPKDYIGGEFSDHIEHQTGGRDEKKANPNCLSPTDHVLANRGGATNTG